MIKQTIACDPRNYGGVRTQDIRYIVVHYTAGDGDTAVNNGLYFQRNAVGASAHWFVDETTALLSVPEDRVAWHCGADVYRHPDCRNGNSIGVELCSRRDSAGTYYLAEQTVENGARLIRELMQRYGIPVERVLRHYDVTGKNCPAPLVEAGQWAQFLEVLMRYDHLQGVPVWGQPTVKKLMEQGYLLGDGQSLDLSRDMLRLLVILDRAGVFGDTPHTAGENPAAPE